MGNKGDFFTEGRGRGFNIPDRKELPATNKARTVPIEINLNDLDKPGVGPVNFTPGKGLEAPDTDD